MWQRDLLLTRTFFEMFCGKMTILVHAEAFVLISFILKRIRHDDVYTLGRNRLNVDRRSGIE